MSEIVLYGSVGASFWGEDSFTARQVTDQLRGASGPLTVRINSGGGVADEGAAIYNALRDYPGEVHVIVDGAAASAASLIAMAGDRITVRRGGFMLIHDPAALFTEGRGTEDDHLAMARKLRVVSSVYADVYAARAGIGKDEAREIMRADTVMDGETAVMMGFATEYDDETEAAIAARFDYGLYANAPDTVREASKGIGADAPGRMALVAMMAGYPAQPTKGTTMTENTVETAAEVTSVEDEAIEAQTEAPAEVTEPAPVTARADTIAERTRVRRILDTVTAASLPIALAHDLIEKGTPADEAATIILRKWKEAGDVDDHMPGRPTARILRDERDTRREGMNIAISAQLRVPGVEVDGRARPFMSQSLAEMAAICADYRGPLRTAGDKIEAFRMATHSPTDFPALFENALNKGLLARYREAEPTYREIAIRKDYNDFRPHRHLRAGDFPMLQKVSADGGQFEAGTFSESRETTFVEAAGITVGVSLQMLIDDDMDAISQVLSSRGQMVAQYEENEFYGMMLSGANADGPTLSDTTRQVFNTTDISKSSSGAAINVASLGTARAALLKRTTKDGHKLVFRPSILLVGPDKLTEAEQMVANITPATAANVNIFSGRLRVVTTPHITGNAWYVFVNPTVIDGACFTYGFLRGREGPRLRQDEPFGTLGMKFSVEHFFGRGAIDFRGGYKNTGA
jgi:ATP-dependent protease ClpP protease subunit